MEKAKILFLDLINPSKTQIKGKLPFIWVFGSGGDDIKKIEQIKDPLNPDHPDFIPYQGLNSFRSRFIQWSKRIKHEISNSLNVPESYPQWLNFGKYSNLIDFELDITSISQGVIIFSESVGAYTEIGMFSCFSELHKNILVIAEEKYINSSNSSFFNYGAIYKINENRISDDLDNIWALDNQAKHEGQEFFDKLFSNISDHFLDIITDKEHRKIKLNTENKHHIMLLFLDLIDLFPNQNKTFYKNLLMEFNIDLDSTTFEKIITVLDILEVISIHKSGNNKMYALKISNYVSCIDYQADRPKRFERADFKLKIRS